MKYGKTFYYTDELNDEVVKFKSKKQKIDKNYKYNHTNWLYRFISFFTYKFLAYPIAFAYFKLIKRVKFHNKNVLKSFKNQGYFVYANHTSQYCDGFCPALICSPQKPKFICDSSNISMKFVGFFTKMWGAFPLPDTIDATKNFYKQLSITLNKNPIIIYPEAHIWPYYTKIRNFSNKSFRYPILFDKPCFVFTTVYKLKKVGKKPKTEIYIDGPFFKDLKLQAKEAQQKLRDQIYNKMVERSRLNDYAYCIYKKRSKND